MARTLVGGHHVGARAQEAFDHVHVRLVRGDVQRRAPLLVADGDVGTRTEQEAGHLAVAAKCGPMQRRDADRIVAIRADSALQQCFDCLDVALHRCHG